MHDLHTYMYDLEKRIRAYITMYVKKRGIKLAGFVYNKNLRLFSVKSAAKGYPPTFRFSEHPLQRLQLILLLRANAFALSTLEASLGYEINFFLNIILVTPFTIVVINEDDSILFNPHQNIVQRKSKWILFLHNVQSLTHLGFNGD